MTIKKKLYINMLTTIVAIVSIAGFSMVGIKFLQNNISKLTEQSTPYQLKTVELQRALQEHTSNLLKIYSSDNISDFNSYKAEVGKTFNDVLKISKELSAFKGGADVTAGGIEINELSAITDEMLKTVRERLDAEESATNLLLSAGKSVSEEIFISWNWNVALSDGPENVFFLSGSYSF